MSIGIVTAKELIKLLKISNRSLYRFREVEGFPQPIKVGNIVRYDGDAVMQWIKEQSKVNNEKRIRGKVYAEVINNGNSEMALYSSNQIQNDHAKILVNAVTGNKCGRITHLYLAFDNAVAQPETQTIPRDEGMEYFLSLEGTRDYMRVPASITPTITDGSAVEFHFIVGGRTGSRGLTFGSNSWIYTMALVAEESEGTGKIFARLNCDPPRKNTERQLSINWSIDFIRDLHQ